MKTLGSLIAVLYSIKFQFFDTEIDLGDLGNSLAQFLTLGLTEIPESQGTYQSIWSIATLIYNILSPVAISIVVLFFMLELIGLIRDFNQITWERLVMKMLKFTICIFIIDYIPTILDAVTSFTYGFYQDMSAGLNLGTGNLSSGISSTIEDFYEEESSIIVGIIAAIILIMTYGAYIGTAVAATMSVFQRFIRLVILRGIAPLPISMMSYSGTQDLAKRYFMNFASALMEAGFILIIIFIYNLGLSSIASNGLATGSGIVEGMSAIARLVISISMMNALLTGGISLASRVVSDSFGAAPQ